MQNSVYLQYLGNRKVYIQVKWPIRLVLISGFSFKPLLPKSSLEILLFLMPDNFTLSNTRQFYSSKGDPLGVKGVIGTLILYLMSFTPLICRYYVLS